MTSNNNDPTAAPYNNKNDVYGIPSSASSDLPFASPSSPELYNTNGDIIFFGVLMGLIVFVGSLLIVIVVPQVFECVRRHTMDTKCAAQKRRKTIHQWLITKTIPHPKDSNKSGSSHASSTTSCADDNVVDIETGGDDDEHLRECMICMEPFAEGESVSWSIHCDHVFHDDCLTEWLMKHVNCPYCRQPVLPDFENAATIKQQQPARKELKQMQADRTKRSAVTRYTLEDGFVLVSKKDDDDGTEINNTVVQKSSSSGSAQADYIEGLVIRNDDNDAISEHVATTSHSNV
eukprot:CAMPEP_0119008346 /NCGR_PEP_ID=MMETSP1176-20130426/3628_1 /TAXON_ID=265551 /ORGANISM="Synedropsis recta cf, Strain CCMP1620" /LENGTH=289 /DNA_ID=CAMNT_0006960659 /DNA_START=35 /DNA_END=904 /DNA_ORIENTATION=-